jgi:hypothetical protein
VSLPPGFEYGYRTHEQVVWCIRRDGAPVTLCRRSVSTDRGVGYFPAAQPAHPRPVCEQCREAMWGARTRPRERPIVSGVCPVCGERQPMFEGRVQEHGGCPGVNMPPAAKR